MQTSPTFVPNGLTNNMSDKQPLPEPLLIKVHDVISRH